MTQVRTRADALALVDRALANFDEQVTGFLIQATAVADSAAQQAQGVVRRCETQASAFEALLAAAPEEARRRAQAELIRARQQVDEAGRAATRVADVCEGVRALQRSYAQQYSPIVAAGRGHLAGRAGAVQQYLGGGGGGAAAAAGSGRAAATGTGDLGAVLTHLGLTKVIVAAADLSDTPIQDGFPRNGYSRADYRWLVQTWNDTVGPGVARGMTRDDFAARDKRDPVAPPNRQTAEVYDIFLGARAIVVTRMPDGSLDITSGHHRLLIARELGIKDLPGQVRG